MDRALVLIGVWLTSCVVVAAPSVRLSGSVDGGPRTPEWIYARRGEAVVLHAELRPAKAPVQSVRWFAIEPRSLALDNTTPHFHFEPVLYASSELEACRDQPSCAVDVRPSWMPIVEGLEGLGTMAFQVEVTLSDGTRVATPGAQAIDRGGLSRDVFRVAIRMDDSYRGFLTELLNTPYIFGSDGPEGRHQADLLVGSDCADLTVYAARRSGRNAKYTSTHSIEKQAPELRRAVRQDSRGVFLDQAGRRIAIGAGERSVREGDLLLFPGSRHVGVLWEDRAPLGVLDSSDLMFHTCWAPPTVEAIGASRCASIPVRVLRWSVP